MDIHRLCRMANEIGQFYAGQPDPEEARKAAAMHLRRFWDPRMRRELLAHLEAGGEGDLESFMRAAVQQHRELLRPPEPAAR